MKEKYNIYLAGPFFDEAGLQAGRVRKVQKALEENKTVGNIFVPMDYEFEELNPGSDEWAAAIYKNDIDNLRAADVIVAIADFKGGSDDDMDSGTAIEVGAAIENKKGVIIYQEGDFAFNLMGSQPCDIHTNDLNLIASVDMGKVANHDESVKVKYQGKHI